MSLVQQKHRDTYAELGAVRIEQVMDPDTLDVATGLIDHIIAELRGGRVAPRAQPDPVSANDDRP